MKIIHCADLHLNSKMQTLLNFEKSYERRLELINNFEKLVNYATNNNVKAILISGDMFDTNEIDIYTKNTIENCIKTNASIDFIYLKGNHDNNISWFNQISFSNLKIFDDKLKKISYDNLDIYGITCTKENCTSFYNDIILDKNKINILSLHGQISKYQANENTINLSLLVNKNIDYLALGHIHSYQVEKLDNRGIYCYSGCLEGRGFDEFGQKGFVLLNIEDNKINHSFIPFAKREFIQLNYDISNEKDWFSLEINLKEKLKEIDSKNFVEIILNGEYDMSFNKYLTRLERDLKDNFYYIKITDNSKLKIDIDKLKSDISFLGEFVKLVLDDENLSQDDKQEIISLGMKSVQGDSIL